VVAPPHALQPGVPGAATQQAGAGGAGAGVGAGEGEGGGGGVTLVAEPVAFYQLPSGERSGWRLAGWSR
jgi:hypothetical protein